MLITLRANVTGDRLGYTFCSYHVFLDKVLKAKHDLLA